MKFLIYFCLVLFKISALKAEVLEIQIKKQGDSIRVEPNLIFLKPSDSIKILKLEKNTDFRFFRIKSFGQRGGGFAHNFKFEDQFFDHGVHLIYDDEKLEDGLFFVVISGQITKQNWTQFEGYNFPNSETNILLNEIKQSVDSSEYQIKGRRLKSSRSRKLNAR